MSKSPSLSVVVMQQTPLSQTDKSDVCIPDVIKKMSPAEKRVWTYITNSLKEYGLIHKTDAIMIHVIVKVFCRWVDAEAELEKYIEEKKTYIVKTPNGYEQPHQLYYVAKNYKKELLDWLPDACLTIMSFRKAKNLLSQPYQGDLFGGDELTNFVQSKPKLVQSS